MPVNVDEIEGNGDWLRGVFVGNDIRSINALLTWLQVSNAPTSVQRAALIEFATGPWFARAHVDLQRALQNLDIFT